MIQKLRKLLCKWFGHSFSNVQALIFEIKTNAINNDMTATLKCRRCGKVFVHKDSHLATK